MATRCGQDVVNLSMLRCGRIAYPMFLGRISDNTFALVANLRAMLDFILEIEY